MWLYVMVVEVKSLTNYLFISKGEEILVVYNGTLSGLITVLWYPHFTLPIVRYTLRSVTRGTYTDNRDTGEIFLNFMFS